MKQTINNTKHAVNPTNTMLASANTLPLTSRKQFFENGSQLHIAGKHFFELEVSRKLQEAFITIFTYMQPAGEHKHEFFGQCSVQESINPKYWSKVNSQMALNSEYWSKANLQQIYNTQYFVRANSQENIFYETKYQLQ